MDDIFKLLAKRIDEYEEDIKNFLASGQAEDMAMYNRLVGRNEGLQFIRQDLAEIEKRYIETQNFFRYLIFGSTRGQSTQGICEPLITAR